MIELQLTFWQSSFFPTLFLCVQINSKLHKLFKFGTGEMSQRVGACALHAGGPVSVPSMAHIPENACSMCSPKTKKNLILWRRDTGVLGHTL